MTWFPVGSSSPPYTLILRLICPSGMIFTLPIDPATPAAEFAIDFFHGHALSPGGLRLLHRVRHSTAEVVHFTPRPPCVRRRRVPLRFCSGCRHVFCLTPDSDPQGKQLLQARLPLHRSPRRRGRLHRREPIVIVQQVITEVIAGSHKVRFRRPNSKLFQLMNPVAFLPVYLHFDGSGRQMNRSPNPKPKYFTVPFLCRCQGRHRASKDDVRSERRVFRIG